MSIFFTSDTHFFHKAIIGYCNRPAIDVDHMNKILIDNWNSKIGPDDDVYHLGDFAFSGITKLIPILEQLNGRKHLIVGNHDYGNVKKDAFRSHFVWIKDYYMLRVHDLYQNEEGIDQQYHQPIVLMHFPILSWDGMSHGSWMLHGHCHGSLPPTRMMRLDVGVDTNNLMPYSYEDVKKIMLLRSVVPVDHHGT